MNAGGRKRTLPPSCTRLPAVNGQPGITVGHEGLRVWCRVDTSTTHGGLRPAGGRTSGRSSGVKGAATVSAADMGSVVREELGRTQDPAVPTDMLDRAAAERPRHAVRPRSFGRAASRPDSSNM